MTPADEPLARSFAQLEILSAEAYEKIRREGISRDGRPHYLLQEFRNLRRVHADIAGRLGLSPRDRAQMKSAQTSAAIDSIDLKRVERIIRARRGDEVIEQVIENGTNDNRSDPASGQ